jgi:hypothetical protein
MSAVQRERRLAGSNCQCVGIAALVDIARKLMALAFDEAVSNYGVE